MRRTFTASFALAAAVAAIAAAPRPSAAPAGRGSPHLAVIVAVDGLSWDNLDSRRPWLNAGLKRLLDEGAVATECRSGHLNTVTSPGHASIATGAPPRVHGIPGNQWYAPSPDGKSMLTIYAGSQPAPGEPENSPNTILGPGRLWVDTLGDRLVAHDPRSKVVAISNKDRSAILLAGRNPRHAVYWFESKNGTYETSAAYDPRGSAAMAAAKIVTRFNSTKAGTRIASSYGATWARLPEPPGHPQGGYVGGLGAYQDPIVGPEFPHDLVKSTEPLPSALLSTPIADRLLTDLALDLLADDGLALGRGDDPDLLAISFSANNYVSHDYGPESLEALETLRALDVQIGRLLDDLTARFGDGVVVALSADHGFLPLPEATKRANPGGTGGRVVEADFVRKLNAAVDRKLSRKGPPLVLGIDASSLWLDRIALRAPGAPEAKPVLAIVQRELATTWKDVIERSFVVDGLPPQRPDDEIARRAWNARFPGRAGDLFVVARYGVLLATARAKGTSHGSPWDYDAHIPLIFWGSRVARRTVTIPTAPYDLAPTLATWLGVTLPDATGSALDVWRPR